MRIDHVLHVGVQDDIGDLQVRQKNLVEEPGQVSEQAHEASAPGVFALTIEKQVVAEVSHHQAAEHTKSHVECIKHPGQDHPKQE